MLIKKVIPSPKRLPVGEILNHETTHCSKAKKCCKSFIFHNKLCQNALKATATKKETEVNYSDP